MILTEAGVADYIGKGNGENRILEALKNTIQIMS